MRSTSELVLLAGYCSNLLDPAFRDPAERPAFRAALRVKKRYSVNHDQSEIVVDIESY
jgi:hypothetical protein